MARHKCAAEHCKAEISLSLEFCRECWRWIPKPLQRRILTQRLDRDRTRFDRTMEQARRVIAAAAIDVDNSVENRVTGQLCG